MAFRHGVYKSEVPTSIVAPSQGESGLPVIVGTAPVYLGDKACVNIPKLVYTYEEAVKYFGYLDNYQHYTLCEFIYSQFALFGQSPCVLINVFDPAKHKTVITSEEADGKEYPASDGKVSLGLGVMSAADKDGKEFTLLYDDEGNAFVSTAESSIKVKTLVKADPTKVEASDIIGGVSGTTGQYSGLELINQVFPKFALIPGLIAAPGWSHNSGVAAVMRAKADNVSGVFTCTCVVDIPCGGDGPAIYSDVPRWKNINNFIGERMIACWPMVKLDDKVFHLSTQMIGVMNKTDRNHRDLPYKSPSNELLQIDSCVNGAGTEMLLTLEQANYLNSNGVVTALNWVGGWRAWGNRTGAYPANTDAKDCFIPIRRMMDYLGNTFITTFWQKTDEPLTPRLVRTIVNSFNLYLNSLVAMGALLGGRVEFNESENAMTDLLNGILKFHLYVTPPVPAETIEAILEYDPSYLSALYNALS